MMQKKYIWLISIVAVIVIILIGGKIYMNSLDKKEVEHEKKAQQIVKAEEYMALYLVRNYEDVRTIEFHPVTQTKETGFWHGSIDVNNGSTLTFSMRHLSDFDDIGIRVNPKTFDLNKKKTNSNENLENVKIKYWRGNNGDGTGL
ncbi:hypothetical protein [Listeria booriae]|nr:hypothetical protein [Listeria booriae]